MAISNRRHWARWIQASVNSYLKTVCNNENIVSLVDGIEDRDDDFMEADDRVEIRVNGPYIGNPSGNYHWVRVFVNIMLTSNMGGEKKNKYQLTTNCGIMDEALREPIPIIRCGPDTGGVDNGETLGCLSLLDGDKLGIRVNHFAQIDPTDRIKQAMVTAAYYIELQDDC